MFSKKWDINLLGINKNTLLDFFTKLADANTSKVIDKILTVESAEDASRCISINGVNHSLDGIRDITVKNADFNIRLGTLVLRYYQNQKGGKNGNSRLAAYHYNGNPALQQAYARNVESFQAELRDTIPEQERLNRTYSFQITSLEA